MPLVANSWRERREDFLKARMVTTEATEDWRENPIEALGSTLFVRVKVWGTCLGGHKAVSSRPACLLCHWWFAGKARVYHKQTRRACQSPHQPERAVGV